MKKLIAMILALGILGVFVAGCSQPAAEGGATGTTGTEGTKTEETKTDGE